MSPGGDSDSLIILPNGIDDASKIEDSQVLNGSINPE